MKEKKIILIAIILSLVMSFSSSYILNSFAKYTSVVNDEISLTVTKPKYKIVFDPNNGTGSMEDEEFEYGETKILSSNTFTREHYSFIGWNTKDDGTGIGYNNEDSISNLTDVDGTVYTFYAQWESKATTYTVRHNKMNLNGTTYSTAQTQVISAEYGDVVTPAVNTYTGFTSPTPVTRTVLKNGALEIDYNYKRNLVELVINHPEYVSTLTPSGEYYYETEITLNALDRDGYKFENWNSGETTKEITFTILENTTKEPIYSVIDYDITYNLDDGSATNPSTYNINTDTFTLNNPSKTKYVFTGWTGSNGDTPELSVSIPKGSFGNKEFTAHYGEIVSTITIGVTDEDEFTIDKTVTLSQALENIEASEVLLEYSLDNGTTWTTYTDPFVINENLTIMARATQIDGNVLIGESSKEITKIIESVAKLIDGPSLNVMMKTLAGDSNPTITSKNDTIRSIRRFTGTFTEQMQNNSEIISIPTSYYPAYMWYEQNTIYYYSEAQEVQTNPDSSYLFSKLTICDTIDMVSELDASKTTNMAHMFDGLEKMQTLDLTDLDTSSATNMEAMFWTEDNMTTSLGTINVGHFNTSNVTNMYQMFYGVDVETLDLSSFDTSNVTNMEQMFAHARKLRSVNLSSFNTSNVTSMYQMFYNNQNAQTITFGPYFNTSSVTNMESMFEGLSTINNMDLSAFDTSSVTNMKRMFYGSMNLQRIYVSSDFNTSSLATGGDEDMFYNNYGLTGGAGTRMVEAGVTNSSYAKIDRDRNTDPGYFTDIADKPNN